MMHRRGRCVVFTVDPDILWEMVGRCYSGTLSWSSGADLTIVTVGVGTSKIVSGACAVTGKGGCPYRHARHHGRVDGRHGILLRHPRDRHARRRLQHPVRRPRLTRLCHEGCRKVDELITRTYTLDEIQDGYDDQAAGRLIRGVVECHA